MEKEFVLYKQALALKKIGFNEPCFRGQDSKNKIWYHPDSEVVVNNPIFSQVFIQFEENYRLYGTMLYGDNEDYETSRDAKIACLEKLIEILNERK